MLFDVSWLKPTGAVAEGGCLVGRWWRPRLAAVEFCISSLVSLSPSLPPTHSLIFSARLCAQERWGVRETEAGLSICEKRSLRDSGGGANLGVQFRSCSEKVSFSRDLTQWIYLRLDRPVPDNTAQTATRVCSPRLTPSPPDGRLNYYFFHRVRLLHRISYYVNGVKSFTPKDFGKLCCIFFVNLFIFFFCRLSFANVVCAGGWNYLILCAIVVNLPGYIFFAPLRQSMCSCTLVRNAPRYPTTVKVLGWRSCNLPSPFAAAYNFLYG